MTRNHEARLRKLEDRHAPAVPMRAYVLLATSREDADRQIVEAVIAEDYQLGHPLIILTGRPIDIAPTVYA